MVYVLPILAVLLSFLFVYMARPKGQRSIKLLLAFSGAFLLALSFFELLPEVYANAAPKTLSTFILGGVLIQIFLEFFSQGAEHGHVHHQEKEFRFPYVLLISLSLHSLFEGVPLAKDGSILYGILIHKIPVALILSIFLLNSNLKMSLVLLFMGLFAIMTPLGSWLAVHSTYVAKYQNELTAICIGIFLHISTVVIFESTQNHSFNLRKLVVIVLGIGIAYLL